MDRDTYTQDIVFNLKIDSSKFDKFKKTTESWLKTFNLDDTVNKQLLEATSQTWKWEQEFNKLLEVRDKLSEVLKNNNLNEEARLKTTEQIKEADKELLDILEKQKKAGVIDDKEYLKRQNEAGFISDKEYIEQRKKLQTDEDEDKSEKESLDWFLKGDKGSLGKSLKDAVKDTFGPRSSLVETIVSGFKNIISSIANFVVDMIKDAFERIEDMASFNIGLTNKFNEEALSYFEEWGLTGSDAYAMQEALKSVGMSNVEDLFTAQGYGMEGVLEEFKTQFEYFKTEYENTDEQMVLTYQQFQKDWSDFKAHFQQEIITFFSNNKTLLTDTLNTLIEILPSLLDLTKGILGVLKWLLPHSVGETTQNASDIYESYGAVTNTSQIIDSHNITNYTFNGMNQNQLNSVKNEINKGNVEYYNGKAVR